MNTMKTLDQYLIEQFVNEDERQFIEHFKLYKDFVYDKNNFIINLDDVYEYIGFTRKENAKLLLTSKFTENIDYKVFHASVKNPKNVGGRPSDKFTMTSDTFKSMCMLASTEKGKETRKYYIKLENCIFDYIQKENSELKQLVEKKTKKLYELGDTIYVVKDNSVENLYKVGSTENMSARDKSYGSHSATSKIVYTLRCNSRKVVEDAVHHILRFYRYENKKDWFVVDLETVIKVVDSAQKFLDNNSIIESLEKKIEEKDIVKSDDEDNENEASTSRDVFILPKEPIVPVKPNFDKFLDECFEFDPDYKTYWIDISSRYRLWSRSTEEMKPQLSEFLKEKKFKECYIYEEDTKVNAMAYSGLRMVPLPLLVLPENPSEIDRFIVETCVRNVTGRVSCKDLGEAFVEWKNNPNYTKISTKDRKELNSYCNKEFLASTVHTGERIRFGFYGVSLKGKEKIGRKSKNGNRKAVEMLNDQGEIINTFESITHAAKHMNVDISMMSIYISAQKKHKGYTFRLKI